MPNGSSGYVHSCVACTDYSNLVAKLVDIRIVEIVDSIKNISKSLSRNAQLSRLPGTGSDKHTLVAIIQKILYPRRTANRKVGSELDAKLTHLFVISIQDRLGKPELGNAIAKYSANLVMSLKYCDRVSLECQDYCDSDPCRPSANNCRFHAVCRSRLKFKPLKT